MYSHHPDLETPADGTIVFRYVNLEKLLAMLCTSSLHMTRLDKLRDTWEGVWPKPFVEGLRSAMPDFAPDFLAYAENLKRTFFVNCWHEASCESAALWDSYAEKAGIAIKSTVRQLREAVTGPDPFFISRVQYLDYAVDRPVLSGINSLVAPILKRKSFEHEREVRLLVWKMPLSERQSGPLNGEADSTDEGRRIEWDKAPDSVQLNVDLSRLMSGILVSPSADPWIVPHIRHLLDNFGLRKVPVSRSQLYDPCVY